ncbi:MAG: penicillin-binding protein 2 [Rickettsiales bacterium]
MSKGRDLQARFGRRAFFLGVVKTLSILGISSRLYYLQSVKTDAYRKMSDKNRIKKRYVPAMRGKILDRNRVALAENHLEFRLAADEEAMKEVNKIYDDICVLLALSPERREELRRALEHQDKTKLGRLGEKQARILLNDLSWGETAIIEARRPELRYVFVDAVYRRRFPLRESCSQITGYVGVPTEEEAKDNPEFRIEGATAGRTGAERAFDADLRGTPGVRYFEVNAKSYPVRELSDSPGKPGEDVRLALDARLQLHVEKKLDGQSGSVVVLDVDTGGIMAYVSSPGYDANLFTGGIVGAAWQKLLNDPRKPLLNRPCLSSYPPGSTFKPTVALGALAEGVNPEKRVLCPGYIDVGNVVFHCWNPYGHGMVNMREAIRQSCNVYFYTLGKQMGSGPIVRAAREMGFGERTGAGLGAEIPALIPTPEWKLARYGQRWSPGDSVNMAIGQGFVLVTPIQLATMAARIASGVKLFPCLVDKGAPLPLPLGVPEGHLRIVRQAMEDVVNHPRGTARAHALENRDYSFAGKTGTVQVISKKQRKKYEDRGDVESLKRTEHHGLFVGYSPLIKPKAAFAVVVEHGGAGGKAAAPVAKAIAEKVNALYF